MSSEVIDSLRVWKYILLLFTLGTLVILVIATRALGLLV